MCFKETSNLQNPEIRAVTEPSKSWCPVTHLLGELSKQLNVACYPEYNILCNQYNCNCLNKQSFKSAIHFNINHLHILFRLMNGFDDSFEPLEPVNEFKPLEQEAPIQVSTEYTKPSNHKGRKDQSAGQQKFIRLLDILLPHLSHMPQLSPKCVLSFIVF